MDPPTDFPVESSDPGELIFVEKLDVLPRYFPSRVSSFQVDLRAKGISSLDVTGRLFDLEHSIFDNYTIWPDPTGIGFDPYAILLTNLDPGMGIRRLHESGIDGTDVKIAVIDQYDYPLP